MSMTMMVGTSLNPRENGILGELTMEVPHLPGNGQVASGLQWSLGTTLYFCLTRPCAGRLLAHFQVLSLHPAPHTGHFPILTQGVVTLLDPYTSCICPELCLRQKDSVSDQFSGLSFPGLLDLSLTPGVESPNRDPCLPLTLWVCLSSNYGLHQPSHSACLWPLFSQLPHARFPWGTKSGPHRCVVSFKQILVVALQ